MNSDLINIANDMKKLGLDALSQANCIDARVDKWEELLILKVAHATEILTKAKIAEAHPLLIFEKLPSPSRNEEEQELTLKNLIDKGQTVKWSQLPDLLWAVHNVHIDKARFIEFGNIRNNIQHFGAIRREDIQDSPQGYATKFIYEILDNFLFSSWEICAVKYSQDYNEDLSDEENQKHWDFIKDYLVNNNIKFHIDKELAEKASFWWDGSEVAEEYRIYMENQIQTVLTGEQ